MLEVKNLSIEFHHKNITKKAVSNVNFTVKGNEILGIVGESGSGKSTIAHAILRILNESAKISGEIIFDNSILTDKNIDSYRGKSISYVSQNFFESLSQYFTIGTQLHLLLKSKSTYRNRKERAEIISAILFSLDFKDPKKILGKYPFELSGGMLQRVIIAFALLNEPSLLIADEPTSAVDTIIKQKLLNILYKQKKIRNLGIILISHDLPLVSRFVDKILVLFAGQIVEYGNLKDIIWNPRHPYTKLLINSKPDFSKTELRQKRIYRTPSEQCIYRQYCDEYTEECQKVKFRNENSHFWRCGKKE